MSRHHGPIRGRGTRDTPPNRFEHQALEIDLEALRDSRAAHDEGEQEPDPHTRYLVDTTRSALSKNDSPDVGFDVGLNPYRGCEHGCVYCLAPETAILHADMTWRRLGEVRPGDRLVGFDEQPGPGRARKYRAATVERVWWSKRPTRRLITKHSEVVTTDEHRWLKRGRWIPTARLQVGQHLHRIEVTPPFELGADYHLGYLAGMTLGDGTYRYPPGQRSGKLGLPQVLAGLLRAPDTDREHRRGFVAGFFAAEGHTGKSPRSSQVDPVVLERVAKYAAGFGFDLDLDLERRPGRASRLRIMGGSAQRIRFFSVFRPAIQRKLDRVFGRRLRLEPDRIEAIEPGPVCDVVDIQTSTRTFFAGGIATHNCYARPTHEYLGYSAGLDFESVILVKSELPALLRKALAAKSWKPQVIGMSGVTDCYQPIERRLGITRRCLEVLAEFRNPVSIITKSRAITRDLDVLGELARFDAVATTISLTSLDPDLCRRLEPRAAQPQSRLAAIEALAGAGIPVGVNLAPLIPGINDHEIPALLDAAKAAGALWASYIMLRLPYGVKDLFSVWLEDHFPERKEKVLHKLLDMRGGRLNDPRPGSRMRGSGVYAEQLRMVFNLAKRRAGFREAAFSAPSAASFRRVTSGQIPLF